MPSVSSKQQAMMGIALSIKRGQTKVSYSPEAAKMARGMSEADLRDFARKVKKKKKKKKNPLQGSPVFQAWKKSVKS